MSLTSILRKNTSYLTVKQVAQVLGKHPQTLYKRLREEPTYLPHIVDGDRLRFDPHAIADWIEARQVT